jgi:hypothetical protein
MQSGAPIQPPLQNDESGFHLLIIIEINKKYYFYYKASLLDANRSDQSAT